jgi:phage tail sheath protein FI
MPEYLSPGVYVEEVDRGGRPIEGVGTSMAAFVGFAAAGPVGKAALITSWSQFIDRFGAPLADGSKDPYFPNAFMPHSVKGYFDNGGNRCWVVRLPSPAGADPRVSVPRLTDKATSAITLSRKDDGRAAVEVEVKHLPPKDGGEGKKKPDGRRFEVSVRGGDSPIVALEFEVGATLKEQFKELSDKNPYVTITIDGTVDDAWAPSQGKYAMPPIQTPPVPSGEFVGSVPSRTGVEGLEVLEDVTLVCCPDLMSPLIGRDFKDKATRDFVRGVQSAIITHCDKLRDRMAILDPLPDLTPEEMLQWRNESNYDSKFAALYYPWINIAGPDGKPMAIPPCGHVAGVYCRSDAQRGVHKAPANEIPLGVLEPAIQITKGEQDLLNPRGVNCIRSFVGRGVRIWGARTLSSDGAWRYINVRRLFNFIEKSLERGTQWTVFEPNDANLWAKIRRDVSSFLWARWREGMLFGAAESEAFYVKCDASINTQATRDEGRLYIEIGIAPVKPAEFVIFQISQWSAET